jgi:hypothetical protein
MLAQVRNQWGDEAGVVEALGPVLEHDAKLSDLRTQPAEARNLFARNLLRLGRPAEAREQLKALLASNAADREAAWLMSRAFLQEGDTQRAAQALKRAGDFRNEDPTLPEPAPYVGAAACAECHARNYQTQQISRHAQSYLGGRDLRQLTLPEPALPDPGNPNVLHTYRHDEHATRVETVVEDQTWRAIVEYVFGSGRHGFTMVGRDDSGQPRVLRISRYRQGREWDLSPRNPQRPSDPSGYLGLAVTPDEVRDCLFCHMTNPQAAVDRKRVEAADRAIGCERCHGPGGHHLKAVSLNFPDLAIARPSQATADQITRLCGQCHSDPSNSTSPTDPLFVRLQATTLPLSRCYNESRGALGCVTCHNPHRDVETSASFYEAKCLQCHASTQGATSPPNGAGGPCPINPTTNCISCHMPSVWNPVEHAAFTDHQIRVHREPDKPGQAGSASK